MKKKTIVINMYISFSSSIIKNPTLLQILYEAKCAKLFYQSVIAYLKVCRCVTSREKKHLSIITAHKMAINMYNICIKHDTVHCYKDNTMDKYNKHGATK